MNPPSGTPKIIVFAAIAILSVSTFRTFAQMGDVVLSFQSISALRADDTSGFGATVPQALTSGYYAAGDDGGSQFFWSASSTATDNGGTVIKPDAIASGSPGRWLATITRTFNVKTFGAKGDGTTNDTCRIQATFDSAPPYSMIILPSGTYLFSTITVGSNVREIRGMGDSTIILWSSGHLFDWPALAQNVTISDMMISPTMNHPATDYAFRMTQGAERGKFLRVNSQIDAAGKMGSVFYMPDRCASMLIADCEIFKLAGTGVTMGWGGEVRITNSRFTGGHAENADSVTDPASIGIHLLGGNGGVHVSGCDLLGLGTGLHSEDTGAGTNVQLFISGETSIDTCNMGLRIDDRPKVLLGSVWLASCRDANFYVGTGGPVITMNGGTIHNSGGISGGENNGAVINSGYFTFSGVDISFNRGIGLYVPNSGTASNYTIADCQFYANGRGYSLAGSGLSVTGNRIFNNTNPNSLDDGISNYLFCGNTHDIASASARDAALDIQGKSRFTLANSCTKTPFGNFNGFGGKFIINDTATGAQAEFITGGASIQKIYDPYDSFSLTPGSVGKTNVYLNGLVVTIENKQGSSREYLLNAIQTREGN
jgi:pectate lyase-like protein